MDISNSAEQVVDAALHIVEGMDSAIDVKKVDPEDQRFWSITTIIGVLDKPALMYWAAEMAAEQAVSVAKTLADRVEEDGREAVVKWLRDARFRQNKGQRTAAELGTAVHEALEQLALTGSMPTVDDEVRPYLEQFDRWAQVWQPEYEAAELTVYSPRYGYAGTADGIMKIDGSRVNFDYKTTRKSVDSQGKRTGPYPEVGLQIAAARYAEFAATWRPRRTTKYNRRYYLLGPDEQAQAVKVPEVDGGIVIHITPEHCDAYPVRCDETVFESFLYILEAARYQFETSKTIIGAPLVRVEAM
jgi:hypothetical protein